MLKQRFFSLFAGIASVLLITALYAQKSLPQQAPSPLIFKWKADGDFVRFSSSKFATFENRRIFAFERVVSIVAVPTLESPVRNIKELEAGKVVGAIYLSTGSVRLNLGPGSYTVWVGREKGDWKAKFQDQKGETLRTLPAKVTEASPVAFPVAYVDQSICYRFDNTIICV